MNTKHRLIKVLSSIALAACCAIWASSAQAQSYSLVDLGVIPGEEGSSPAAINQQGHVAGTSGDCAFRYNSIRKIPMEDVGRQSGKGTICRGFGINDSGLVVGDSNFGGPISHAALFSNGLVTDLGTLKDGGSFSQANSINASGQVVGFSSDRLDSVYGRAFIISTFDRSGMTDLGTLGGTSAQAWGINDSGFVTGNSQIKGDLGLTHAFIWEKKAGMLDLGTLAGNVSYNLGNFSYGTFINGQNHVVGYSTFTMKNDRVHAFLHNGKEMIDLGSLGGASLDSDNSYALGVNDSDQVVGYSYLPSICPSCDSPAIHTPQQVAFVYNGGVMVDLNDLIGKDALNYRLDSAMAINNKGEIAALAFVQSAGAFHAVLLTPVGEFRPAVKITAVATYAAKQRLLTIKATCTGGGPNPTAPTLSVYTADSTETLIGVLTTKEGRNHFGQFTSPSNPQTLTIMSSNGGRLDVKVQVNGK